MDGPLGLEPIRLTLQDQSASKTVDFMKGSLEHYEGLLPHRLKSLVAPCKTSSELKFSC